MIFPLQAGEAYVPPEMSKKSTPASSSHLMTTHCSAKLVPPSITAGCQYTDNRVLCGRHTVMTVQLRCNDELIRWNLVLDGVENVEDEAGAVFQTSAVLCDIRYNNMMHKQVGKLTSSVLLLTNGDRNCCTM
jgi:hypothetical protein